MQNSNQDLEDELSYILEKFRLNIYDAYDHKWSNELTPITN